MSSNNFHPLQAQLQFHLLNFLLQTALFNAYLTATNEEKDKRLEYLESEHEQRLEHANYVHAAEMEYLKEEHELKMAVLKGKGEKIIAAQAHSRDFDKKAETKVAVEEVDDMDLDGPKDEDESVKEDGRRDESSANKRKRLDEGRESEDAKNKSG